VLGGGGGGDIDPGFKTRFRVLTVDECRRVFYIGQVWNRFEPNLAGNFRGLDRLEYILRLISSSVCGGCFTRATPGNPDTNQRTKQMAIVILCEWRESREPRDKELSRTENTP
jgi:hypothetical protein